MRPLAVIFLALAVPAGLIVPSFVRAQDATAICTPIFGGETAAIMVAFDNLKIDRMEGCNAFKFLLERNGSGSKGVTLGCYRSEKDRVIKLNPSFAVGLFRALTEMERLYGGRNTIQSGYRCDPTGNHPRGCAADIIWSTCSQQYPGKTSTAIEQAWRCSSDQYDKATNSWSQPEQKWIDANGKNDRFKIHLRLRYGPEGHHVEPLSTQGCATGPTVASAPTTPTNNFANQLRQALGMPQQPTQMAPVAQQPIQQQQSPLSAFAPAPLPQPVPTSDSIAPLPSGSGTSSVADQLRDIINAPTTTAQQPTASTAPIVITADSAGTIVRVTYSSSTQQYGTGSLQPVGQETFSSDSQLQPATPANTITQRLIWLYQQLVAALTKIFSILRPFGITQSAAPVSPLEHIDEYSY